MKPIVPHDRQVIISSNSHEVVDMSLDQNSLVHLMNQFIDMYKDSEMAVLREYSTNAWDSHVEAGISDPIEVFLPDEWTPTLRIVDHGIGLSHDELRDIYSKYGASTKRESNEVVGMLGLGCKSALTYTEQFTIVAIKGGMRTVVSVSRNALGAGSLHFMEHVPTDEANGVTITIPARRENTFAEKAAHLFRFWPKDSVLIDGKPPVQVQADRVVGNVHLMPGKVSYVVMGNVPYPVEAGDLGLDFSIEDPDRPRYDRPRYEHSVLAYLPIGTVEPAPNRESLRDTEETKAALELVGRQFAETIGKRATDDIDAAPTRAAALRRQGQWRKKLPRSLQPSQWTYRGEPLPVSFKGETDVVQVRACCAVRGFVVLRKNHKEGYGLYSREKTIPAISGARSVWLHGFDLQFTAQHRRKLDAWAEAKGLDGHKQFILTNAHPNTMDCFPWIRPDWVFSWDEVRATKLPKQMRNGSGRLLGAYDYFPTDVTTSPSKPSRYDSHVPGEILGADIDASRPIFFYVSEEPRTTKSRWTDSRFQVAYHKAAALWELAPTAYLLVIPPSRETKLRRDFPKARSYEEALKERYNRWKGQLDADQLAALAMEAATQRGAFAHLDPAKLDDPKLRDAVRVAKLDIKKAVQRMRLFIGVGIEVELPKWRNPLAKYHLHLHNDNPSSEMLDHYHLYLNAAYAEFGVKKELKSAA